MTNGFPSGLGGGSCSECGAGCREKADDGRYYCDACWAGWQKGRSVDKVRVQRAAAAADANRYRAQTERISAEEARIRALHAEKAKAEKIRRNLEERARRGSECFEESRRLAVELADALHRWRNGQRPAALREVTAQPLPVFWEEEVGEEVSAEPPGFWSGLCAQKDEDSRPSAVYWGICDLKYDPDQADEHQIKVLELGDGRASRISHNAGLPRRIFDSAYQQDPEQLKRGVMVDNKRYTHDMFVECGLDFLRPRQIAYRREYAHDLAGRIITDFALKQDGMVVLKLLNRARGAGVVVCPAAELDATLRLLLQPPVGREFQDWLAAREGMPVRDCLPFDMLEEQKLHYWSNEGPVFLVEELCRSRPVTAAVRQRWQEGAAVGAGGGQSGAAEACARGGSGANAPEADKFDGTMRVVFVLRRADSQSPGKPGGLAIDWVTGYWKLPPCQVGCGGALGLEAARDSIVSSFNSEEKRTAPVPNDDLVRVYAALTPALLRVFEAGEVGMKNLTFAYEEDHLFRAFLMCRHSAQVRIANKLPDSARVLVQAENIVKTASAKGDRSPSLMAVHSYILRTRGVYQAVQRQWHQALMCFQDALVKMPTNSAALYLQGLALQELDRWPEAVRCHKRAFALDPDFRSPLIALGMCWTKLGEYDLAVDASEFCLFLQPDCPAAQFNIGQAIYQRTASKPDGLSVGAAGIDEVVRARARRALERARKGIPSAWDVVEGELLQFFVDGRHRSPDVQPFKVWRAYTWRP